MELCLCGCSLLCASCVCVTFSVPSRARGAVGRQQVLPLVVTTLLVRHAVAEDADEVWMPVGRQLLDYSRTRGKPA